MFNTLIMSRYFEDYNLNTKTFGTLLSLEVVILHAIH